MELSGGFYEPPRSTTPLAPTSQGAAPSLDTQNELPESAIAAAAPSPVPPPATAVLDLDQELSTVMKGIGSFWGNLRKQSVTAYHSAEKQIDQYATTARKDLTPLVSKARANLDHLSETAKGELARLAETTAPPTGTNVMIGADGTPVVVDSLPPPKVDKGKGVDRSGGEDAAASNQTPAVAASAFFAKMQTQLASNPNVEGLSKNLQRSFAGVQSNLAHLPVSLQTNLTQLQAQLPHLDAKLAEDYLHKGESWFTEFSGEIGRLAKDAVRVVPPSEAELSSGRNRKREERLRKAEQVAIGRKDTLLLRLRSDPAVILVDPAQPPPAVPEMPSTAQAVDGETAAASTDTREAFSKFLQAIEDRGGLEGEGFKAQVAEEQDANLRKTFAELVPSKLTAEAFWSRYFFRRAQIDEDERRRREVLEGAAADDEEEFSWDMEEEDDDTPGESKDASTTTTTDASTVSIAAPLPVSAAAPTTPTPGDMKRESSSSSSDKGSSDKDDKKSPRASSDGASSYDVVGMASGTPSEAPSEGEAGIDSDGNKPSAVESDGEDSDWE